MTKSVVLWGAAAASTISLVVYWTLHAKRRTSKAERTAESDAPVREIDLNATNTSTRRILTPGSISVVHGSVTGTCRNFAERLYATLSERGVEKLQVASADDFDWWDELVNDEDGEHRSAPAILILLLPTYTGGTFSPPSESLASALEELSTDWRIAKNPLRNKLSVAVFGMGSSEYDATEVGRPAKTSMRGFQKLGARSRVALRIGDDAVGNHAEETFSLWQEDLLRILKIESRGKDAGQTLANDKPEQPSACGCGNDSSAGCCQTPSDPAKVQLDVHDDDDDDYDSEDEDDGEPEVMDLEDMGDSILASQTSGNSEPREMVTPSQAMALKKEGYRLIGTHSAVKLCRWTKHQLRGRGGCYKHTFYGITSYQCMEATPSLACANKCVFCWRHHKNPVGKEWRWKTDDPNYIVEQAVQTHVQMIKEARGIPGVRMDRWQEALTVRHCALSLVGEPIMYPRIDELLADLHRRKISTFLVTNGQHPAAIESLRPITQLYVSVDAPTQESLIAIDRPLFRDAWDRLKKSLCSLKSKGQRTVARLTVVKGWNSDEISGYARLIALGQVSLVEVKGVTFCGKSDASNLNMTNTPWHHEVVDLTRTLMEELTKMRAKGNADIPEYELACEHKHSCSVLLARVDQFAVDDPVTGDRKWRTWIDYDKFHELAARHAEDPSFEFTVEEYTAETPAWALFGAEDEGFDPTDKRHRRKQKYPMYSRFDENGVPTHDHNGDELSLRERDRLSAQMQQRMKQIGSGSTVTEMKGGAKEVLDASLMFRGLTVTK